MTFTPEIAGCGPPTVTAYTGGVVLDRQPANALNGSKRQSVEPSADDKDKATRYGLFRPL